jgi:HEAT repeat protein
MRLFMMMAAAFWTAIAGASAYAQDPNTMFPQQQPPPLQEAKIGNKPYLDWLRELNAVDPAVKEAAMQALMIYGSQKEYAKQVRKEVGPAIVRILSDPATTDVSIKVNGALVLGTIGLDEKDMVGGVSCLVRMLSDNESVVRLYATTALAHIGSNARAAIPNMVRMLKDKASWEIRRAAVAGLTRMAWDKNVKEGGPDAAAFRALADALSDRCLQVRQEAAKGFIFIGPPMISSDTKKPGSTKADLYKALEALEGLTLQRDKSMSILAHWAILSIDPPKLNDPQEVDKHLHAICRFLSKQNDAQVRIDASFALAGIWDLVNSKRVSNHPNPKMFNPKTSWGEVIHLATLNLEDKDETIVCWACSVLGTMGPAAEKAIKDLEKLKERLANRDTGKPDLTKKMVDWALAKCHGKEVNQVGAADRTGK